MDQVLTDMGRRLRQARIDAGFPSAVAAAKSLGMPHTTYTAHENNQNDYSPEQAKIYADKFKTTVDWLLFAKHPVIEQKAASEPGIDRELNEIKEIDEDASRRLIARFRAMLEGARTLLKT